MDVYWLALYLKVVAYKTANYAFVSFIIILLMDHGRLSSLSYNVKTQ